MPQMANRKGVEGDGDKLYANGGYSMVPLILEPGDSLLRNVLTMKGSDQEVATLHSATQNDPFVQSTPVCHVQSRRHLYRGSQPETRIRRGRQMP